MSRLETLKKARISQSVKFLEFTRIVARSKKNVAVFFEGEDQKYYAIRLNTILPNLKWYSINCAGKTNVVSLRKSIRSHSQYKNSACLFFVDSDFDDNTDLHDYDDTYVSPCYSIENLYISTDAFKGILSSEFSISEHGDERECFHKAVSAYKNCKDEYLSHISNFNYWIRAYRVMEKDGKTQGRLNINNIDFGVLIKVNLNTTEKLYESDKVCDLFPEADKDIEVDIASSVERFRNLDKELWFRGKQHLEFFRQFVSFLKKDRCNKSERQIFKNKGNVKLNLTKANTISELSQYADTPPCLNNFLQNYDPPI